MHSILTPKSEARKFAEEVEGDLQALLATTTNGAHALFGKVWQGRGEVTPQMLFNELGPKASELFMIAGAFAEMINTVSPGSFDGSPPCKVTFNPDGTVTLG